jgi:hypothetical protein
MRSTLLFATAVFFSPVVVHAQARPMIEHIEPTAGPVGTRVRIVGRGFQRNYRVLFNERAVTATEMLPERITVVVPDGASTGRWVLSNGTDEVESEVFRVTEQAPPPTMGSIEPATAAPGVEVVIRGQNFAARPTDNSVRIGVLPMVVRSGDTTTLRVIVPDGAQSGPVFVRTHGAEARSTGELRVAERLVIREFVPAAVSPGGRVTLRGAGFAPALAANRVTLNGRPVRVLRATATELDVEVPVNAQGGPLAIEVQGGARYETAQRLFVGAAPTIRELSPVRGAPGSRLTLRGTQYGSDASRVSVTMGGRVAPVVSAAPNEVVVTVPEGATSGRVALTANGIGPVESTTDFMVLVPVSVTRFEPRTGDVGDRVTLTGTGFSPTAAENTVQLGAQRANVVSATGTELVVEVPVGARSGQWAVSVANNGQGRARDPFMVSLRPRIQSVEPPRAIPGARVTLRGVNFPTERALMNVRLNGQDVEVLTFTREVIEVTVPRNAQTGRFEVVARLQGTGRAANDFVVLQPVTLREVSPPAAPVGSVVTLRGEGFEPDPARLTLRMGTQVIRPTRTSTTEVVFTVPRGARGASISLEAEGRQPVTSAEPFAVTLAPVLVSVTPAAAAPGARLTLRGRNFGQVTTHVGVTVGGVACPVASVTPTMVVCELAADTRSGPVVLRVANAGEVTWRTPLRVSLPPQADAGASSAP